MHMTDFSGSASKIFVTKYDSTGTLSWLTVPDEYENSHITNSIATDTAGNSFITGQFFHSLTFDSVLILDAGNIEGNVFVARIDSSGQVVWMNKAGGSSGYAGGHGLDIDHAGNVFLSGFYRGTVAFDTVTLTGPGTLSYDVFIAKCSAADGSFSWVNTTTGGSTVDEGISVAADNAGGCYFGAQFGGVLYAGNDTVTGAGQQDILLSHVNAQGNFLWSAQCGGNGYDNLLAIKARQGSVYLEGEFTGTALFGTLSLTTPTNNSDVFVARMEEPPLSTKTITATPEISIYPNPATTEIFIKSAHLHYDYSLMDETGRVITTGVLKSKLNISSLTNGIYYLELRNRNTGAVISRKVTKI
jgi:hypothetical protein